MNLATQLITGMVAIMGILAVLAYKMWVTDSKEGPYGDSPSPGQRSVPPAPEPQSVAEKKFRDNWPPRKIAMTFIVVTAILGGVTLLTRSIVGYSAFWAAVFFIVAGVILKMLEAPRGANAVFVVAGILIGLLMLQVHFGWWILGTPTPAQPVLHLTESSGSVRTHPPLTGIDTRYSSVTELKPIGELVRVSMVELAQGNYDYLATHYFVANVTAPIWWSTKIHPGSPLQHPEDWSFYDKTTMGNIDPPVWETGYFWVSSIGWKDGKVCNSGPDGVTLSCGFKTLSKYLPQVAKK